MVKNLSLNPPTGKGIYMSEQEQLQRLSEEVARAYLRHLEATTGGNTVTYDGVTRSITLEELVFGLIGVAHFNAKNHPNDEILKDPYKHLSHMIDILSKPYVITEFGLKVIEHMNEISIHKQRGVLM